LHLLHMQWRRRDIVARSMPDLHLVRERQLLFFSVARWQALFAHRLPIRQLLLAAGLVLETWRRLSQTRGLEGTHHTSASLALASSHREFSRFSAGGISATVSHSFRFLDLTFHHWAQLSDKNADQSCHAKWRVAGSGCQASGS